jgi:hypothetical protein
MRRVLAVASVVVLAGCRIGGCAAATLGDIVGETGDAHCDRRFVTPGKDPASFCQEVIDTVATSQFEDDCRSSHGASADDGKCPRERIIAGCQLHKENDDGSKVYDWYYDVTDLEDAAAHDAGPPFLDPPARTKEDVQKLCADPSRYDEGASFTDTP